MSAFFRNNPATIKNTAVIVLFIVLIGGALYLYHSLPATFTRVDDVVAYLRSYGFLAPLISFMLLVIQAFFPVIPFFLLAGANGILYQFAGGFLVTWLGALTGASAAFLVARSLGREWVLRKCEATFCHEIALMSGKKGFGLVFLARIVPIIPSTLVNFLAGVSAIRFITFLAASALGKLPFIIFYTALGEKLAVAARYPKFMVFVVVVAGACYLYFKFKGEKNYKRGKK